MFGFSPVGSPHECYLGSRFVYYKCFLLAGIILIKLCFFLVTIWPLSMNVSHTPIHFMYPFGQNRYSSAFFRNGTILPQFMHTSQKNIQSWFIDHMITPNKCVSRSDVLNDFGTSFICQFGSFLYIS